MSCLMPDNAPDGWFTVTSVTSSVSSPTYALLSSPAIACPSGELGGAPFYTATLDSFPEWAVLCARGGERGLVSPPVFKTGAPGNPRWAGSIPVRLRCSSASLD